jgi:hypothetical protein
VTSSPPHEAAATPAAPFFIIGNDRSGTTMLRLILDRGEAVAIPTESMFLGDFAPVRAGRIDLSHHARAVKFAATVWNHPKVRLWGLEGPAPVPASGLSHADAYRFAVEAPYRAFAQRDGKARWGDKTPYYLDWVDEIKAVWPDAKFVELVRDGRDVAMSIMPLPFGGNNAWVTARDWARGIRLGRAAADRYPDDVFTVQYEHLVSDPEPYVRRLCDFLNLTYSDDMLNIERTDRTKVVEDQKEWFLNIWSGINQNSVGKWRGKMSARDQAIFARVAGRELELFDYDLGEHAGEARGAGVGLHHRAHNFGIRLRNFVRLRLVQERGRELGYVVRRKLQRP